MWSKQCHTRMRGCKRIVLYLVHHMGRIGIDFVHLKCMELQFCESVTSKLTTHMLDGTRWTSDQRASFGMLQRIRMNCAQQHMIADVSEQDGVPPNGITLTHLYFLTSSLYTELEKDTGSQFRGKILLLDFEKFHEVVAHAKNCQLEVLGTAVGCG